MLNLDVILLPAQDIAGRWILYNVFTRTALGTDSSAILWLDEMGSDALTPTSLPSTCRVWKAGWFAHEEGTMSDPTCFRRQAAQWGEPREMNRIEFLQECRNQWLIVDDPVAYRKRFARKKSALDGVNFGNFHDQMGRHLILSMRVSPSKWWLSQKFTSDFKAVRTDNLYGKVQVPFLYKYFGSRLKAASHLDERLRILDFGCGIGFYSNVLASNGHSVLGIDPNPEYVKLARSLAVSGASFEVMSPGHPQGMDSLSGQFDVIFIQDTLLFYFVKINPKDSHDLSVLLADVRRLLRPGGRLVVVEPHPTYYLSPWLGDPAAPFTLVTEHRHRNFSSAPNQATLITSILAHNFVLAYVEDCYAPETADNPPSRGAAFAQEFPLWTLFEFILLNYEAGL